jgi:hypothetical protein
VTHDRPASGGKVIQVNGVKLYYEVHGHGTPLLHAGSLTCDSWQPYLAAFAQHYRVFTPDKYQDSSYRPSLGEIGVPPPYGTLERRQELPAGELPRERHV